MQKNKDYIYDLECYPNVFTFSAIYMSGKGAVSFEISDRKNQTNELLEFLRNIKRTSCRMIGYNNIGFDYPMLHYILLKAKESFKNGTTPVITAQEMYTECSNLINRPIDDRFGGRIKDKDIILPQVDLYLVHHFDNRARATSLKMLEFNMRSSNIEDLPFPVGTVLTSQQIDTLLKYNMHDVTETLKFYNFSKDALTLRDELTNLFGFDCTNFNDTKIGKQLFITSLEKEKPGACYTQTQRGRKMNQTKRDYIPIQDCILPYVEFRRPEFVALLKWFKQQIITETKGVFSDIDEDKLGDVALYANMVVKRKKFKGKPSDEDVAEFMKEHGKGWVQVEELKATEYLFDELGNHVMEQVLDEFGLPKGKPKKKRTPKLSYYGCWRVAETLNVVVEGLQYDYGLGGIHAAKVGTHRSTADKVLVTQDVASYYPNLAIKNDISPAHLGSTFCKVYSDLYDMRKAEPKGTPANAALKLALNGTYGDSGNEFSPLYDPQYTMSITINGQMLLSMLIEQIITRCNAEIIMANTDGFEFFVTPDKVQESNQCIKEWEELTKLQMEGDLYSVMFVNSVNHYISVNEKGKVKLKGMYEHADYTKLGWHKNHSAMVIAKAVEAHLVNGIDYEEFIRLHRDKFDFCLRTKVPRSSSLVLVDNLGNEVKQQNICRYYPSKNGGKLVKIMPPIEGSDEYRRIGIDTDYNVVTCNDISNFSWSDLDYSYYLREAKVLIEAVTNPNSMLQSSIHSDNETTE
jgi:hypothetical protein